MIAVVRREGASYPDDEGAFPPDERFPESPFPDVAGTPNAAYAMVRQLFLDARLDETRAAESSWNPLGQYIRPGESVFVLCNFVHHRRPHESLLDFRSKCTHGSVLRALIDYALIAAGPSGRVTFGNAPLQSGQWQRVLSDTGASRVLDFYKSHGAPVEAMDLRLFVAERDVLGKVVRTERRDASDRAVEVELREDSLLSELYGDPRRPPRFRVSDYDPGRTEAFHGAGIHRYVVHRALLDADVVISLPKLKTHNKVGITCGLKGFVGTVGHKDCLAHYRAENPARGGDEYPDRDRFLVPVSRFHDWVHTRPAGAVLQPTAQVVDRTLRRIAWWSGRITGGAWHGNDTAWRMTLDLARIVHCADASGRVHDTPRRRHLLLIDGIVGGEGEGPLASRAAPSGVLLFADNVAWGDRVAARLLGFDPDRIPLLARAGAVASGWSAAAHPANERILVNAARVEEHEVRPAMGRSFVAPRGWRGHVEPTP